MAKFKTLLTLIISIILLQIPVFATNTTKTNVTSSDTTTQSSQTQTTETSTNSQSIANQGTPISSVSSINSPVNPTVLGISDILNIILIAIGIVIIFLALAIFARLKK